ncbi:thiamine diphosphokinase [Pediococcus acidilactici]
MKTFNLLVGGDPANLPDDWQNLDGEWVGVDRGALRLLNERLKGGLAIGDFDSVSKTEFTEIEAWFDKMIKLNPIKDDTDTEAALAEVLKIDEHAQVRILGVSGGRIDHLLANVLMVLEARFRRFAEQIMLVDRQNLITFFNSGKHTIQKQPGFKYLSFIPLTSIDALTLDDGKYQLHNHMVPNARAYVSNEFMGSTATVYLSNGLIAVIQSKD